MIWIVALKRFLQEYHNHIRGADNKFVNWFVDEGSINFYIEQTNGVNSYCYIHLGNSDTVPVELRTIINGNGMILGIEKEDNKDSSIHDKLDDISAKLKFDKGDKYD